MRSAPCSPPTPRPPSCACTPATPSSTARSASRSPGAVAHGRAFEVVPGVSASAAAAAAAGCELTVPGVAQSVVLTRFAVGTATSMPDRESIAAFSATGATMAVFLSVAHVDALARRLLADGRPIAADTPVRHRAPGVVARRAGGAHHDRRAGGGRRAPGLRSATLVPRGPGPGRRPRRNAQPRVHAHVTPPLPAGDRAMADPAVTVVGWSAASRSGPPPGRPRRGRRRRRRVRHLAGLAARRCRPDRAAGPLGPIVERDRRRARRRPPGCCVLASGDPGFFGIARPVAARFGRRSVRVHPAPSSVALAFARARRAVGRRRRSCRPTAVGPRRQPGAVVAAAEGGGADVARTPAGGRGRALLDAGGDDREVAVCSNLAAADEGRAHRPGRAGRRHVGSRCRSWSLLRPDGARRRRLSWGLPEERFAHRGRHDHQGRGARRRPRQARPAPPRRAVGRGRRQRQRGRRGARLAPDLRVLAVERDASATSSASGPTPPPTA